MAGARQAPGHGRARNAPCYEDVPATARLHSPTPVTPTRERETATTRGVDVLRGGRAAHQQDQAEHLPEDQIQQSSYTAAIMPNRWR